MIRQLLAMALAGVAGLAFARGDDDVSVTFSTRGPDRYLDGSVVMDGECYALVWSADGVFEGFTADGAPVDAADRVVRVGAVAKGGRCRVAFQLTAAEMASLAGGSWAVYLLDTRVCEEGGAARPLGLGEDGKLLALNGYGEVSARATARTADGVARLATGADAENGAVRATACAAAPRDVRQPKIVKFALEGDEAALYVERLPGYLRAHGGADVRADGTTGPAVRTAGEGGLVRIAMPRTGASGFYRVVRSN